MNTVTNNENVTMSTKHGDNITTTASPRPWRIPEVDSIPTEIWSADGTPVARGVSGPNAALIVNAVNYGPMLKILSTDLEDAYKDIALLRKERDHLRDIVRRMIPLVEVAQKHAEAEGAAIKGLCSLKGVDSHVVDSVQADIAALVREARAAIGKDEK